MAAETQYTANTGMATISTANTNLDGTGTLGTVLTAASNGTLIKTVTIKAQGSTTNGMVRLFIYDGTTAFLISEVEIPAVTVNSSGTSEFADPAFEISIPVDYPLYAGGVLKASTEKAETFNIIAEGLNWAYYTTSVRPESSKYTANTAMATISTANTSLDGSGTIGAILTAASNGTVIQSITIKAQETTEAGMIRFFIYDGTNTKLLREIPVPIVSPSATAISFYRRIDFSGQGFALKNTWILKASTQRGQSFNIIAEGLDLTYPA